MLNIRAFFDEFVKLSDEEWHAFSTKLVEVDYPKNSLILAKGEVESHLSFINKGVMRYFVEKNDSQHTIGFSFSNEFGCAYDSFLTRRPVRYYVESLAPTQGWKISFEDLQLAYQETENGNEIGRYLAEQLYMNQLSKVISQKHYSAEERYLELIDKKPHYLEQIPLKHIASYIGVTPQTLSRIRRNLTDYDPIKSA